MFINNKNKLFNSDVGGDSEPLNDTAINNQNHIIDRNNRESHKKIPDKNNNSVFDSNLEQTIFSHNAYNNHKIHYLQNHLSENVINDYPYDVYNPIIEEQYRQGLIANNIPRLNEFYINIDSRFRNKNKSIEISKFFSLSNNPITLYLDSNTIFIHHPNHPFNVEDKITLEGVEAQTNTVSFIYSDGDSEILVFTEGSKYVKVNLKHNINVLSTDDFYCEIIDFSNPPNNIYVGNIPLTYINKTHKIILSINGDPVCNDYFYIQLPYAYKKNTDYQLSTETRNFKIKLFYYYNIPIHHLNAGFPNTIYKSSNYHIIKKITDDGYFIDIPSSAFWNNINSSKNNSNASSLDIGGNHVRIGAVKFFNPGYPEPNEYSIKLNSVFKNIVEVSLVSSEFPIAEYNLYKIHSNSKNNTSSNNVNEQNSYYHQNIKLYWQNYSDGDHTYSTEIPPGQYTADELENAIHDACYYVSRYYYENQASENQPYTNHNFINVDIDESKNITTFKSYTEYILQNSIVGLCYIDHNYNDNGEYRFVVIDDINQIHGEYGLNKPNHVDYNYYLYPVFVIIKIENNTLQKNNLYFNNPNNYDTLISISGDVVVLNNISNFLGIPTDKINSEFEVFAMNNNYFKIINQYNDNGTYYNELQPLEFNSYDYFMIQLNNVDINLETSINSISSIFNCYCPNIIRLLWNYDDTCGDILGFKDVGNSTSITQWNSTITNKMDYEPDVGVIISEDDDVNKGNSVNLSGIDYIFIVCDQFNVIDSVTTVKNAFAKILLSKKLGSKVYNSFVNIKKRFFIPINEVSDLTFHFYTPDGELYDFNGLDHSFMIKIVTLDELPLDTNISSHSGTQI